MHRRTWTDSRDEKEWTVTYNPGVELARPKERELRSRLIFESKDGERLHTDAVYGADLATLDDPDLQGLLDQAREERDEDEDPRDDESPTPTT